ncbi:MAG: C-terminal binding protein, partial [Planctomycetaceae bacterium]
VTDHPWPDLEIERSVLSDIDAEVAEPAEPTAEGIAAAAPSVDAIGVCWASLPGPLLERSTRCRIVARFGAGLDNIPVDVATRLGIPVTFVPDYCVAEVADHTLALVLAALRDIPAFDRALKSGRYDSNRFVPRRLSRLTIGLVGFGRIGRAVADRASAFGMTVLATSRSGETHGRRVALRSLDELVASSDVISLHVPLTSGTRRLIDASRLAKMRPSAYLVNTSRGPLIDPTALLAALDRGEIAGAALDVFDPEPPAPEDALVNHPRVIATPHVAFRSEESVIELRTRAARQIRDALTGRRPEHVVNPDVFA